MFRQLDELLRGERTSPEKLASGRLPLSLRTLTPLAIALAASYGFFMGWFAAFGDGSGNSLQLLASAVKLPALFLLTLVVTFPSLYVFNALLGSRLRFDDMLRLLVGAVVVNAAVAASLGPILGFFTFSTNSYSFIVFLNVALLSISGVIGLSFLLHTLRRLSQVYAAQSWNESIRRIREQAPPSDEPATGTVEVTASVPPNGALPANSVFRVWVLIYALVGAQMGWILRPFIGSPTMPFTWFRPRQGNFFESMWNHLQTLIGVHS